MRKNTPIPSGVGIEGIGVLWDDLMTLPMPEKCAGCGKTLKEDWTICPYCGRSVSKAPMDTIVEIIAKIIPPLIEAGLMHAETTAHKKGQHDQAEQLATARKLARELAPLIIDVITTYAGQKKIGRGKDKDDDDSDDDEDSKT
jgi:hypothetical protein